MIDYPATPTEQASQASRRRAIAGVFMVFVVITLWSIFFSSVTEYADIETHFKYGSIGADNIERGIPLKLWAALPELFPEYLPSHLSDSAYVGGGSGYAQFGITFKSDSPSGLPIGMSQRCLLQVQFGGINCAMCHDGKYRLTPTAAPTTVLGMPSNTVDLQGYFRFLFACASDDRFDSDYILPKLRPRLSFYERQIYPRLIREVREAILEQQYRLSYWDDIPDWGPGRVDTFSPYKRLLFDMPVEPGDPVGTADFPALWNQGLRQGMWLHWDGNNNSVDERNMSAAIGAGYIAPTLDYGAKERISEWVMHLSPPDFPLEIDQAKATRGKLLYRTHCASCHGHPEVDGFKADLVGTVIPTSEIGTDPNRERSFDAELAARMNTLGRGYKWEFSHFRDTNGYASPPLDGIWLLAPYLHNGSVPTLWHLLTPAERPIVFYRGNDVLDVRDVGFEYQTESAGDRRFFKYDTTLPGNANSGHEYGAELLASAKYDLIEYLKTL